MGQGPWSQTCGLQTVRRWIPVLSTGSWSCAVVAPDPLALQEWRQQLGPGRACVPASDLGGRAGCLQGQRLHPRESCSISPRAVWALNPTCPGSPCPTLSLSCPARAAGDPWLLPATHTHYGMKPRESGHSGGPRDQPQLLSLYPGKGGTPGPQHLPAQALPSWPAGICSLNHHQGQV